MSGPFSRPEQLEFPTETWAAQDMRKSDVFKFAVKHSDGPARARFVERSQFFFDQSVQMLAASATRFFARPRVILTVCGFMHAAFVDDSMHRAPAAPAAQLSTPTEFVPQKVAVLRTVRRAAVATGVAVVILVTITLIRFFMHGHV